MEWDGVAVPAITRNGFSTVPAVTEASGEAVSLPDVPG
jgi:hypothetical protein